MATLNQLASRIANMINQPDNHELKERIKDMFKSTMAKYIRQSSERHGLDDILMLSFIASVDRLDYEEVRESEDRIVNRKPIIGTVHKLPVPIRVHNDSPFTYVGSVNGESYKYLSSIAELNFQTSLFPTGKSICYTLENGRIFIHRSKGVGDTDDRRPINEILIKGIWENPEEVLTMFRDNDGQDIEIPFPNDIIETSILEILKVEFGMFPNDISIKVNDTQMGGTSIKQ